MLLTVLLTNWDQYVAFGLDRLGVDIAFPEKKRGIFQHLQTLIKPMEKRSLELCTFRSVSIGQGKLM